MNKEDRKKELQRELEQLEQEQAEEGLQSVLEKLNEPVGEYEYTDMGNAERYVAKFGHSCKYIYEKAKWIVWDGNKWRFDEEGVAVQNIKECNR